MAPQWGSERIVPIPSRVASEDLEARFNSALAAIGITDEIMRKRVLVWHSLRHTFNSVMKGRIDSAKLMKVVGHRQSRKR